MRIHYPRNPEIDPVKISYMQKSKIIKLKDGPLRRRKFAQIEEGMKRK